MKLKKSDINHLRLLLAYVRCEIGQSPEENIALTQNIMSVLGEPDKEAKARIVKSHQRIAAVPKYVRAAVKALEKAMLTAKGDTFAESDKPEYDPVPLENTRTIPTKYRDIGPMNPRTLPENES